MNQNLIAPSSLPVTYERKGKEKENRHAPESHVKNIYIQQDSISRSISRSKFIPLSPSKIPMEVSKFVILCCCSYLLEEIYLRAYAQAKTRSKLAVFNLLITLEIVSKAYLEYLENIKTISLCFQQMHGLTVNYEKSVLVVIAKENSQANGATKLLDCRLVRLLITYLGMPLGYSTRKCSSWHLVIERIEEKLNSWKARGLSQASQVGESVLNSMPLYFMSLLRIPRGTMHPISKIQRKFLRTSSKHNGSTTLIKGDIVQRPDEWQIY